MKARSKHAQWGYVGEGFIKEVDFGRVWLRLNESDDSDKDEVIAEWKGDAKAFLSQTLVSKQANSDEQATNKFLRLDQALMN